MIRNIFENIPDTLPDEFMEVLTSGDNIRIERIVSRGHATPRGEWYDQNENEFVLLLSGGACLVFEDSTESVDMVPGDWLVIQSHRRHRVEHTVPETDTVWLAVFFNAI